MASKSSALLAKKREAAEAQLGTSTVASSDSNEPLAAASAPAPDAQPEQEAAAPPAPNETQTAEGTAEGAAAS